MTDSVTDSSRSIRLEMFLRRCASTDTVEMLRETVARIRRLEERSGRIDVCVETWSSVRPVLETLSDSDPAVSPTVNEFLAWADREGYTLRPAFERRETPSRFGQDASTEIRVPVVCVAVYENGDLTHVAPCSDGDRTYTVDECLTALENGETEPLTDRGGTGDAPREWSDDRAESAAQESE